MLEGMSCAGTFESLAVPDLLNMYRRIPFTNISIRMFSDVANHKLSTYILYKIDLTSTRLKNGSLELFPLSCSRRNLVG